MTAVIGPWLGDGHVLCSLIIVIDIMAEQASEPPTNEVENNDTSPANDPKNMQEVTQYVSYF